MGKHGNTAQQQQQQSQASHGGGHEPCGAHERETHLSHGAAAKHRDSEAGRLRAHGLLSGSTNLKARVVVASTAAAEGRQAAGRLQREGEGGGRRQQQQWRPSFRLMMRPASLAENKFAHP